MIHSQSPDSMRKEQDFPVSIEVQFLGGNGKDKRPTGNVCTPGTNIVMHEKLITQHCNDSHSKTYHGDEWVTAEVEVHGNGVIRHKIDGETVLEYEKPQLDDTAPTAAGSSRTATRCCMRAILPSSPKAIRSSFGRWRYCP